MQGCHDKHCIHARGYMYHDVEAAGCTWNLHFKWTYIYIYIWHAEWHRNISPVQKFKYFTDIHVIGMHYTLYWYLCHRCAFINFTDIHVIDMHLYTFLIFMSSTCICTLSWYLCHRHALRSCILKTSRSEFSSSEQFRYLGLTLLTVHRYLGLTLLTHSSQIYLFILTAENFVLHDAGQLYWRS